ncbi:MAG TPA: homocysteine S-methyltransferase family protein [Vicinamibacteria bacterium]|nr:homocysteine S-methyltransferase family protein [Vicinamibacteria bacterium]
MQETILDKLKQGVVLGDGGYVLELERRCLTEAGPFTPQAALEHPDAVRELHFEFLRAGSEVLQVLAFYGSREKLHTVGYAHRVEELNRKATRIAKEAASDRALVAADLSPTWKWAESPETAQRMFDEQIAWQTEEGSDFIIGETFFHLGEAELCLARAKALTSLPVMITMAMRGEAASEDGVRLGECMKRLVDGGADIVGVNCMRDPERMYPLIEEVRRATDGYIAAQPVAYRCSDEVPWFTGTDAFPERLEPTQLTRFEMGEFARRAKDMGVNYIGGCCGSAAIHLRQMAEALGKYRKGGRAWSPNYAKPMSETEYGKRPVS